jgi:hypothetical protein
MWMQPSLASPIWQKERVSLLFVVSLDDSISVDAETALMACQMSKYQTTCAIDEPTHLTRAVNSFQCHIIVIKVCIFLVIANKVHNT